MKRFLLTALLVSVLIASFVGVANARWWTLKATRFQVMQTQKMFESNIWLGDTFAFPRDTVTATGIATWCINTSGGDLEDGNVLIYDQLGVAAVEWIAFTSDPETVSPDDDLTSEVWMTMLRLQANSVGQVCSAFVFGIPYGYTSAVTETIPLAVAGTQVKYSSHVYWTQLDSIIMSSWALNDSIKVDGIIQNAVTTTTTADATCPAGVAMTDAGDNEWVLVMKYGYHPAVKLVATTVDAYPGRKFNTTTSAGKGAPVASPTAGASFGTILGAGGADATYPCWVNVE